MFKFQLKMKIGPIYPVLRNALTLKADNASVHLLMLQIHKDGDDRSPPGEYRYIRYTIYGVRSHNFSVFKGWQM